MSNFILIKNGTIITHNKTIFNMDILLKDDKISAIEAGIEETDNCAVIDASGLYIIPGLIDMHCDICEPGYDFMEDYESAGQSAINGGFTSITCNPNVDPVIDNKVVAEYVIFKSQKECQVNVYPYGSLTKGCLHKEIAEIGEMQLAGVVAVSDGDISIEDPALIKSVFKYCSMFDIPVIVHCEERSLSNNSGVNEGIISTKLGVEGASFTAETIALQKFILLAEEAGIHLHVTHISTKRAVEMIRLAKKTGIKVTAETSPHYFSLNEEQLLGYNTFAKVNPPLRTPRDVDAVLKGVADGIIDVITSDHKPNTIDSKDVELELASFGISSFETTFSVAFTKLVHSKLMSMEDLVRKMSYMPSNILTLNKGAINTDQIADLVIFDPNKEFIVDSSCFKSKAKYSPYDGEKLFGWIKYTIVGGKVYETNQYIANQEI
jgi:dihydroorotase